MIAFAAALADFVLISLVVRVVCLSVIAYFSQLLLSTSAAAAVVAVVVEALY